MARAHGTGRACYMGQRPPEGSCEACRAARRAYTRRWYGTAKGRESDQQSGIRYRSSAKGQLAVLRNTTKKRGSGNDWST